MQQSYTLPTELITIIVHEVVSLNDVETLKACALAFRPFTSFFQRAIRGTKPFNIPCFPLDFGTVRKSTYDLLDILDAEPPSTFAEEVIRDVRLQFVSSIKDLEDPQLRVEYILSRCTQLRVFSFDMMMNGHKDQRNWTSISTRMRTAIINTIRQPSVQVLRLGSVNFLPWSTLFRSRTSLDRLVTLHVGEVMEDSKGKKPTRTKTNPTTGLKQGPTTVRELKTCPSSAQTLANALHRDKTPVFDFSNLESFEINGDPEEGNTIGTSWHRKVQTLLHCAMSLKKLIISRVSLKYMGGLLTSDPPLRCLSTLQHIIFVLPPSRPSSSEWSLAYPSNQIITILRSLPSRNSLDHISVVVRLYPPATQTNVTQNVTKRLTATDLKGLTEERFPRLTKFRVQARVDVTRGRSARSESMLADLRHSAEELRLNAELFFMVETEVEEWDDSKDIRADDVMYSAF